MESVDIIDQIKCPICFEIPEDKIFLCKNGHAICEQCLVGLKLCPQCRVSYEDVKVRNRTMEVLLDSFRFTCTFSNLGCKEELSRKQVKEHSTNCKFSGKLVKLCCEIGFKCDFSINLKDIPSAVEHLKTEHNVTIQKHLSFSMNLLKFDKAIAQKIKKRVLDSIWTPVFIDHKNISNPQQTAGSSKAVVKPTGTGLLLLCFIHGKDKSTSWMLVRLSDDKQEECYHAQFEIRSQSKQASSLYWRTQSIDVTEMNLMVSQSPFRIPNKLLVNHYVDKTGVLSITATIIPLKGKSVSQPISPEQSNLCNILLQQNVSIKTTKPPKPAATSMTENRIANSGTVCQECGIYPITGVKYRRLHNADYSVCQACIKKKNQQNHWFAVIRKLEHNDQNRISILWKNKQKEWKSSSNTEYLLQGLDIPCIACELQANYTCLECENINFCEACIAHVCLDHLLATYINGLVKKDPQGFRDACQTTHVPFIKCNNCKILYYGSYFHSLHTFDYRLCTPCTSTRNPQHGSEWFALITDEMQADIADGLWLNKVIDWGNSGIWPLQNYTTCSCTKGCRGIAMYACLQCDQRSHYSVCETCFKRNNFEKEHLFARFL